MPQGEGHMGKIYRWRVWRLAVLAMSPAKLAVSCRGGGPDALFLWRPYSRVYHLYYLQVLHVRS